MQQVRSHKFIFRSAIVLVIFSIIVTVSMFIAAAFRYEGNVSSRLIQHLHTYFYYVLLAYIGSFLLFHLQRLPWRYTGTRIAVLITLACIVGTTGTLLLGWVFQWRILRSILLMTGILNCLLIFGARLVWGVFTKVVLREETLTQKRVLIVGAGELGRRAYQLCLQGHMSNKGIQHIPVAFVDDNLEIVFRKVCGISVEGGYADIPRIVEGYDIHEIIIAISESTPALIGQIVKLCMKSRRQIPILTVDEKKFTENGVDPEEKWCLRNLVVDDLLSGVKPVLNEDAIYKLIEGRTVLVTGGGGSVGSELCEQIIRYNPGLLIVLDVNENFLVQAFDVTGKLAHRNLTIAANSVSDANQMEAVFAQYKPHIVFHAAGYKNQMVVENCIVSAAQNNILGINNVLAAAEKNGTELFIHLSSDEALGTKTTLGAIKRIEEMSTQLHASDSMRCASIRFGNVLGAYGSVVSRINKQIDNGEPVNISDPDAHRYFMSSKIVAQMLLQIATDVWVQKDDIYILFSVVMGWSIRILDLAETLIRLRGYEPGKDITVLHKGEQVKLSDLEILASMATQRPNVEQSVVRLSKIRFDEDRFRAEMEFFKGCHTNSRVKELLHAILYLNEAATKNELKELVRSSVEETQNELLDQEAKALTNA